MSVHFQPTIEVLTASGRKIHISPEAFDPTRHTKVAPVEPAPAPEPKPKRVRAVAGVSDIPDDYLARMSAGALKELPEFRSVPAGSWRNKQELINAILKVRADVEADD